MSDEQTAPRAPTWSVDRRELVLGVALVLLTFLMPVLFNVRSFGVSEHLSIALAQRDKAELLDAAFRLVMLNSLRSVPHYVGTFFISESIETRRLKIHRGILNAALVFALLPLTYRCIELLHGIHYDFGIPAICVGAFAIGFGTLGYRVSLLKKALMIALVLTPLQFMDIAPVLGRLPVGRGETSSDIKLAAVVLEAEKPLNALGLFGMILFLVFAFIVLMLLREESTLRELSLLREQNEEMRTQSRINEIRTRNYEEIQYLVHDLKSPLTAIQTMVGVMEMEHDAEPEFRDREYLRRIERAVEQMSGMISEILYEDKRSVVDTQTVLDSVLSQTSVSDYAQYVRAENLAPGETVFVNRIFFSRALVNLLQNAAKAVPPDRTPEIWLRARRRETADGVRVLFTVSDNGRGIPADKRKDIWRRGVSGGESSGIGLAFVRGVVERMDGTIQMESTEGAGTEITIALRQGGEFE